MHFETHALCNSCTLQQVHFSTYMHFACYNVQCAIFIEQANQIQISQMDQLNRSASQISWTDQFSIFEALASLYIRRLIFQFVRCCNFWVLQRPCSTETEDLYENLYQRTYSWFSQIPRKPNLSIPTLSPQNR